MNTTFIYDDGGRAVAGYKGNTSDCVTRAIAIATGKPYKIVYEDINLIAKHERTSKRKKGKSNARLGVYKSTYTEYLTQLGWKWTPTMLIGQGCKVHLKASQLPTGIIIVRLSRHLSAVINGVVHDTFDPSRGGLRCVYGYYSKSEA